MSPVAPVLLVAQCVTIIPQLQLQADCANSGTLRWNGQYFTGSFAILPPCPGPFSYGISGFGGPMWSGLLANDWIQESPNSWRFNAALPPGNYIVSIQPTNAPSIGQAPQGCAQANPQCYATCLTAGYCYAMAPVVVPVSPGDCGVNVQVRAWLDGALPSGTLMTDELRTAGLIPLTEPYSSLGYTYTGATPGASIQPALLAVTGNNAVVDWVILELRSSTTGVAWSKPVLLRRNGYLMDIDGNDQIFFPMPPGNYRMAIRHRNHLPVMTNATYPLSLVPAFVDFGHSNTAAYGTNARVLKGTFWCLWAADTNGDGTLKYTGASNDRDPILTAIGGTTPNNTLGNQYSRLDVNLDGVVKYTGANNDRDPILTNVGSTTPNNTRTQQLP